MPQSDRGPQALFNSWSLKRKTIARTISRIEEANMASETSSLVGENILANSGISMIAQIHDTDRMMSQLITNATGGR